MPCSPRPARRRLGLLAGQPLHLEPTCLAVLALAADADKHRPLIDQALAALDTQADGSGLYRLDRGRPQAVWPTALVVATRAALGQTADRRSVADGCSTSAGTRSRATPKSRT